LHLAKEEEEEEDKHKIKLMRSLAQDTPK